MPNLVSFLAVLAQQIKFIKPMNLISTAKSLANFIGQLTTASYTLLFTLSEFLMTNNDIFRRIRFIFNFDDATMMAIFALAEFPVTRSQVSDWLKQNDVPDFKELDDSELATFLNGLIIKNRGRKEGELPTAEQKINNNMIFRKLKIALDYKDNDIISTLDLARFAISKHELSALFRKADHKNYRECQSQILRNFLKGLQLKHRTDVAGRVEPIDDKV